MPQKKKQLIKLIRINTRIMEKQDSFIKKYAARNKMTEGETTRLLLDEGIKNVKSL